MHTVFINTSKKTFDEYEVLFDIHRLNREFVSMQCSLAGWFDPEKGFSDCIRIMSEQIDGYAELNGEYDLIVYIDLNEIPFYAELEKVGSNNGRRMALGCALALLGRHMLLRSIVSALKKSGRAPQGVLVMFGEESLIKDSGGGETSVNDAERQRALAEYLNAPEEKTFAFLSQERKRDLIAELDADKGKDAAWKKFYEEVKGEASRARLAFVACPYQSEACRVNKCSRALDRLGIARYLLQCVAEGSAFLRSEAGELRPHEYCAPDAKELSDILKQKAERYREKLEEIGTLPKKYAEVGLAPQLYAFDGEKFGLDAYGDRQGDGTSEKGYLLFSDEKEKEQKAGQLLQCAGGSKKAGMADALPANTSPGRYLDEAKKIRDKHRNYLRELDRGVHSVLSRYAQDSEENSAALLPAAGEYPYAKGKSEADYKKEDAPLSSVRRTSEKAYQTMMGEYLQFCAQRPVAVTDIDEQYDWFVARVKRIEASIKGIRYAALGVLAVLLVLFIPFFCIRFEAIFANTATIFVALCSLAVPVALFVLVVVFVIFRERRQFAKAWKSFKTKADAALQKNKEAVGKYCAYLFTRIPALRWVYDYKLDVDHYAESCGFAAAKLQHHREKLTERIAAIDNIRSDLEVYGAEGYEPKRDDPAPPRPRAGEKIDYNRPFCAGEVNRKFYSVIGQGDARPDRPKRGQTG